MQSISIAIPGHAPHAAKWQTLWHFSSRNAVQTILPKRKNHFPANSPLHLPVLLWKPRLVWLNCVNWAGGTTPEHANKTRKLKRAKHLFRRILSQSSETTYSGEVFTMNHMRCDSSHIFQVPPDDELHKVVTKAHPTRGPYGRLQVSRLVKMDSRQEMKKWLWDSIMPGDFMHLCAMQLITDAWSPIRSGANAAKLRTCNGQERQWKSKKE